MAALERIHLDPLGGLAGDMFAAALADTFPDRVPGLMAELAKLEGGEPGSIEVRAHRDCGLVGTRFCVAETALPERRAGTHRHGESHEGEHGHLHVPHRQIRERLQGAGLQPEVLRHAVALFQVLAEAEGKVHGVSPDEVAFHEIGAWDSIVDFVAAAYFIATLAPRRWSVGALPVGGGTVRTAHGVLPVPAPATTLLLQGLAVIDDGIEGERVTPTGAAIARYLSTLGGKAPRGAPERLGATGYGFGTRRLPDRANVVRCVAFEACAPAGAHAEPIAVLQFEVDDQTAEDLSVALQRIREAPGVLDATQAPVYGKKGRLATQVQVLARMEDAEAIAELCLAQTTTLGVRIAMVARRTAARTPVHTQVPEPVQVKVAERPGGKITAKAEMDDLARLGGDRARREAVRARAEASALQPKAPHDDDRD